MSLSAPKITLARGVIQFGTPLIRDGARDEAFITAVQGEFPSVVARQQLPAESPALTPHLVLASTSSQLAVSLVQADFLVKFYGDFGSDAESAFGYVKRKLLAALEGLEAVNARPSIMGLISTLRFPLPEEDASAYVLQHLLRTELDPEVLQDAMARVAVKVADRYFVTLTVSNYESRLLERPVIPGVPLVAFRPWEGRLEETGLELGIDVNNALEARLTGREPTLTRLGVEELTDLVRHVVLNAGPNFAETGSVMLEQLSITRT